MVHADIEHNYCFSNVSNEPDLRVKVNGGEDLSLISGGAPAVMQEGYFVSDPSKEAPYNYLTILKKFTAGRRTPENFFFSAELNASKESINLGETVTISASDFKLVDPARITNYRWTYEEEGKVEEQGSENTTEAKFDFNPKKAGTYSINLVGIMYKDGTALTSQDSYIYITVEDQGSNTASPQTGDGFEMTPYILMIVLAAVIATLVARRRKER